MKLVGIYFVVWGIQFRMSAHGLSTTVRIHALLRRASWFFLLLRRTKDTWQPAPWEGFLQRHEGSLRSTGVYFEV